MALVAIAIAVVAAGIGLVAVGRSGAAPPGVEVAAGSPAPAPVVDPSASRPPGSIPPTRVDGAPPRVGSLAVVGVDGALSIVGPTGQTVALSGPDELTVGFPAWSPDGSRLAAVVATNTTTTVDVFAVDPARGRADPPVALYRSTSQAAFYVSWTPGGDAISFLANDADVVDLRVVSIDRTTPLDDADTASVIRRGTPLFFDWIDDNRLLAHVGSGDAAFLGEVDRDGTPAGPALSRPGNFRSPQVSRDGRWIGWVRAGDSAEGSEVVVATRAGDRATTVPVFGAATVAFGPASNVVASIGADQPGQPDLAFPLGPLRLIDAETGASRTLLRGAVVAAFWSPDGRTIFALRLQPQGATTAAATASPTTVPTEVHALFVDVASGAISVDQVVQPGPRFVSEFLPYFDQYARSHRLWAPDSSSFLLPIVADDGHAQVIALPRDGAPVPFSVDAPAAFWSP
jgi:TolB protein